MPCLLKQRTASSPGIVTFTQGEALHGVLQKPDARALANENTASGSWLFGVHLQGNTSQLRSWSREPWQSFVMWPDRDAAFLRGLPENFVIDLNCINFMPHAASERNDEVAKFWDICVLSRAATVKRIGPTLYTIRHLMDLRPGLRVVFIVPDYRDQSQGEDTYRLRQVDRQYFDLPRALFSSDELKNLSFLSSSQVAFGNWPLATEIVTDIVRKSRFAMLLSHREGTARALGEALLAGTPLIVSENLDDGQRHMLTPDRCVFVSDDYGEAAAVVDDALRHYHRFQIDRDAIHQYYAEECNRPRLREALARVIHASGRAVDGRWFLDQLHWRLPCHGERQNHQFIDVEPDILREYLRRAASSVDASEDSLFEPDRVSALCQVAGRYRAAKDLGAARDAAAQALRFDPTSSAAAHILSKIETDTRVARVLAVTGISWRGLGERARAMSSKLGGMIRQLRPRPGPLVIRDRHGRRGDFSLAHVGYDTTLKKEDEARRVIFGRAGTGLRFLDVGGGDGSLTYLLGIEAGLRFKPVLYAKNKKFFDEKFEYFCLDIARGAGERSVVGDICDGALLRTQPRWREFFDVVYSNNAFEHFSSPWVAASNLVTMLKPGGLCVMIAPFSLRYHEVPGDYFRFTHSGLTSLFEREGNMRSLVSGYDIVDRRVNWQGGGNNNDICPVDEFGAWRENWFVVAILEKIASGRDAAGVSRS